MNRNPKELLQIIHSRGEQWWTNPQAIAEARKAAQELATWIDTVLDAIQKYEQASKQELPTTTNENK